jgi:hypothetical protein
MHMGPLICQTTRPITQDFKVLRGSQVIKVDTECASIATAGFNVAAINLVRQVSMLTNSSHYKERGSLST